jgi:hypothetical protein
MAASKPKPKAAKEKKPLSPSHVKHLRAMMDLARDPSNMSHPLVVPPAGTPADGNVTQQASGDDQLIPAKTGEYVIPEPVVRAKGTQFFDNLIKKVLQDSLPPDQAEQATEKAGSGTPETGYKWGGEVSGKGAEWNPYGHDPRDDLHPTIFTPPIPQGWASNPSTQASGGDQPWREMSQGGGGWFNWAGPNQLGNIGPPNTPWFTQGPTMVPTTLGNSGYPMAIPLGGIDQNTGTIAGLPPKKES